MAPGGPVMHSQVYYGGVLRLRERAALAVLERRYQIPSLIGLLWCGDYDCLDAALLGFTSLQFTRGLLNWNGDMAPIPPLLQSSHRLQRTFIGFPRKGFPCPGVRSPAGSPALLQGWLPPQQNPSTDKPNTKQLLERKQTHKTKQTKSPQLAFVQLKLATKILMSLASSEPPNFILHLGLSCSSLQRDSAHLPRAELKKLDMLSLALFLSDWTHWAINSAVST